MTSQTPRICRILPHEDADGPANMARDEALLDLVASDPEAAAFRTYGWTEPTLSLGYFQSIGDVDADPRWRTVPVVRRPTGGGAIWHDHEVTYALAVPRTDPLSGRSNTLYQAVHAAVAGLLRGLGVEAGRRGGASVGTGRRPFLCFTDRDPEDIVVGPWKVLGSAQRRRSGAILQHGSLLLCRSSRTPELPGVGDLAQVPGDAGFWSELLRRRLPEALGFLSRPVGWPVETLERARGLENGGYRDSGWTRRR